MTEAIDSKIEDKALHRLASERSLQSSEVIVELNLPDPTIAFGNRPGSPSQTALGFDTRRSEDESTINAIYERVRSVLEDVSSNPLVLLQSAGAIAAVLDGPALCKVASLGEVRSIHPNTVRRRGSARPL